MKDIKMKAAMKCRHQFLSLGIRLFLFYSCCISFPVFAQKIHVVDGEDSLAIPGAYVFLFDGNDTIGQTITDSVGEVALEAFFKEREKIMCSISFVGYENYLDTLYKGQNKLVPLSVDKRLLGEVVVTGQYSDHHAMRSVNKITVINRQSIEAQGAVNLTDVLSKEANIRISQDNVLGGGLSVQGLSGQNIKILIDGVPVIGRLDGNIDINQINLNDVERIEIVEGPMAVEYGSNALGCTINIITCKKKNEKFLISQRNYYETAGQYNTDLTLAHAMKKQDIYFNLGRNYFDGWSPGDPMVQFPKSRPADTNRTDQWNPKEQFFGKINWTWNQTNGSLRAYAHVFHEFIENKGMPRQPYFESAFDDHYKTLRADFGLDYQKEIAKKYKWQMIAAYNHYQRLKQTWFRDLTTLQSILSANTEDQDTSVFRLFNSRGTLSSFAVSRKFKWMFGYDVVWEWAEGKRIDVGIRDISDLAGFASAEWNPGKDWTIRPGIRLAYNSAFTAPPIPSLHIRKAFKKWILRASYAHGFRSPSLKELYFEFVDINHNILGNSDLTPEYSKNVQGYLQRQWIRKKTMIRVEGGVFYNHIRDLITLAQYNGSTLYTYTNIGKYETAGIRGSLDTKFKNFSGAIEFVYTGYRSELSRSYGLTRFTRSPEFRSSHTMEIPKWNGRWALYYKYNGRVIQFYYSDASLLQGEIEAYHTIDLTYTQNFLRGKWQLQFGGKNLMNVTNLNFNGNSGVHGSSSGTMPMAWGRSYFLAVNWKFSKS